MSENLVGHIKENPGVNLTDAAYTLQVGRKAFRYRKMMVCPGADEIDLLLTSPVSLAEEGDKPVIFIFAGQGNQYIDMGLDLYRAEKDFREEVDRCFEIANSITGYNLKEILYPGLSRMSTSPRFGKGESGPVQGDAAEVGSPGNPAGNATLSLASPGLDIDAHIGDTGFSQPLIFIIEYALARLLIKKGIKPAAMIGYSLGEYIAACLSGVFSLKDALKLVVGRGKLARETAPAVMLNVPLPGEEMEPLLPEDLSLAIASDPTSVVTGPPAAIESFEKKMKERRLLCGRIDIAHAFHSPLMEPIRGKLEKAFAGLTLNSPQLPYISNVSGDWITPREAVDPQYWGRHLCSTVRFSKGINKLLEMENAVFIEIGPGRMLGNIVRQQKKAKPSQLILNVLRHRDEKTPDDYYFLKRIGQLWGYGLKIDWGRFHTVEKRRRIPLPTYPFEKQRYWLEGNPFKIGQVGAEAGQQPGDASTAVVGGKKIPAAKIPVPLHSRPELSSTYTAPVTGTEKTLAGIWRDLLHLEEVGVYDDFFELGGDSLKVTAFRGRIHRETGIDVVLSEFFSRPTIRQIAGYIDESRDKKSFCRIEPVESKDYYPLSDAQTRLFILQQVESANVSYNLPFVVFLEGILDKDRVETSFGKVINRHETFRTGFFIVDEQPVQRIHSPGDMDFKIEFEKKPKLHHSSSGIKKLVLEFIRPFDLSQAPLLRIGLIAIRENKHLLMVDMHHIITDAFSHNILVEDFVSFYSGEELAPLKLQYKDYVEWRNRREEKQKTLEQEAYWLKQLAGPLPVLDLPTDFVRPESQGFEGGRIGFSIGREKLDSLRETTLKENVTMHMLMLAILYVLLARLSGQEDIIIGTPIAGRNHPDVENIIGLFVNTLVQRNYPGRGKGFPDFLKEVKQNSLDAYENQDYPFDDLVKKLVKERDNSRNPLFDVMFEMQKIDAQQQQGMGKVGEFELKPYKREITTTLVDMDWVGRESEDNIYFTITYCTKLFREETVVFTADCFQVLIDSIIEKPGSKIKDLDYTLMEKELSTKEETKIEFNF
ncbi:MAG: acyltransferase domain-containing protein [Candidatus Aminicenantes bacterium]|nr:acyltransferase domain-containing protein [Candidatus Aminicenantes bacterium]